MSNRALIVTGGGLTGAYSAGVTATLCRELGANYFNNIDACSVGVFASTFYLANQPEIIEDVWRNRVHGRQLVNPFNPLRRKQILDLEYLIKLFQTEDTKLDIKKVLSSTTKLTYAITDSETGKTFSHSPKSPEEIFSLMKTSCSLPFVTSPVRLNGSSYIDGSLTIPLPLERALKENDEILVSYNKPKDYMPKTSKGIGLVFKELMKMTSSRVVKRLLENFEVRALKAEKDLQDPRVRVIRPRGHLALNSILDTNKDRINQTFDEGVRDTQDYLRNKR